MEMRTHDYMALPHVTDGDAASAAPADWNRPADSRTGDSDADIQGLSHVRQDKVVSSRFVDMSLDDLDPGDVVIRTKYSTINYKDALSYSGAGKIMRKFPDRRRHRHGGHGGDRSNDPRWKRGDKVIVTGYDLGVSHDGGYSEYVRVPADWIVRRPESMTAFDAMTLGTAGFTAALAIHLMQHNGLVPDNGPVAVTGATGGVGLGRDRDPREAGLRRRRDHRQGAEADYLRRIGARDVMLRSSIELGSVRPLEKATWAGAVDNLGGDLLALAARDVEDRRDGRRRRASPPT